MPSRFRTGVIVGKFYPPQRGHKFLVDTALAEVDHLTIFVCGRSDQDIPGELRVEWMREIHPGAEVRLVDDVYPDDDSELWARLTVGWLGYVPEAAFTSESYGPAWAHHMGSVHVEVDRDRRTFPCSGRGIRQDPLANWDCLEPCVRAYYAVRVCVLGAESTGTTTLAMALADHYRTAWVPEYGREFTERFKGRDAAWCTQDFVDIATEQLRREDLAALAANRVLICDTDALATSIWHERYVGAPSAELRALAASRSYTLYLLTDVDIPFVQDGLRDGEHLREWMQTRFIVELNKLKRPFVLLAGDHQARLSAAIRAIDARVL